MVAAPQPVETSERRLPLALLPIAGAVAALAAAELLFAGGHVAAGLAVDGALVLGLANLAAVGDGALLAVLALVPLGRLLGYAMPLGNVTPLYWHALVGAPLLPALWLAARAYGMSWSALGLRRAGLAGQLVVAATGVPLGLAAYAILRPPPLRLDWSHALLGSLTLLLFAAFVEELLFRGLLQHAAAGALGAAGPLLVNVVFAVSALGSRSVAYAVLAGLMGGWFSLAVARTRCLWGAIAAHAFAVIGLVLVWPAVL